MSYRLFLAAISILFCFASRGVAQRTLGVDWNPPHNAQQARMELQMFQKAGISYLQISRPLDKPVREVATQLNFTVLGMLPVRFPISQTFAQADSAFKAKIEHYIKGYASHKNVKAIGLFAYAPLQEPAFQEAIQPYINNIRSLYSGAVYYQTTRAKTPEMIDQWVNFKNVTVTETDDIANQADIGAYTYSPPRLNWWKLKPVKQFLEQTESSMQTPVFFDAGWLLAMLQKHPDLRYVLHSYATSGEPIFLVPSEKPIDKSPGSIPVIALLLVWVILAATCHYSPVYRKSFVRYYTGHQFYTKDVLDRHVRNPIPGLSILIQHTILGGITLYCFFNATFSMLGSQALFAHYPLLSLFGTSSFTPFIWGFLLTLVIEILCIGWFWLGNPRITHFTQVTNLYFWPLQINLLTTTLITTLFMAQSSLIGIYVLTILFLVIFAVAFIINAFKSGQILGSQRFLFLAKTVGIYTLLFITGGIWLMLSPRLFNIIALAVSLP